jgi:hypothetical protein
MNVLDKISKRYENDKFTISYFLKTIYFHFLKILFMLLVEYHHLFLEFLRPCK